MGRLNDKVAVITGGAGGMGASHAKRFIEEGAKVVVADLRNHKGKEFVSNLGENAMFVNLDVTSENSWIELVKETEETFGSIDILVNNAGIDIMNSIEEMSYVDYKKQINVNVDGIFLSLKYVYPSMKKVEAGSIINVSSTAGLLAQNNNAAYIASKFAVRGLSKAAAREFAKDNIRVNSVHPGPIRTPLADQEDLKDFFADIKKTVLLDRLAESYEVTNLVLYLASDESSYSTGAEFVVDGGQTSHFDLLNY